MVGGAEVAVGHCGMGLKRDLFGILVKAYPFKGALFGDVKQVHMCSRFVIRTIY